MTRAEFLERLGESRLLTADQLRQAAGLGAESGSAEELADALTLAGLLTPFQSRRILRGEAHRLALGQYRLLDELGRGGMGQVYKARHAVMGRVVALKVLHAAPQTQDIAQGWFEREVRTLTQMHHPNIVMAHDANEVDGVRFLVMEYVEGQNLQTLVREAGPLPIALACALMAEAAAALQYAHEMGLVHRDIKPANLLVPSAAPADGPAATDDGEARPRPPLVKVVDFGLARLRTPAAADTIVLESPDHFAGTPDFVSPEQCRDVHAVDVRSDLYSLGCTFYFMLTGRPPFGGRSIAEKLAHHLTEPPPPVTRLRPDAPAGLEAVILRLMAKNPAERFQTPAALARALRPYYTPGGAAPSDWMMAPPALPASLAGLMAAAPGTVVAAGQGARPAAPPMKEARGSTGEAEAASRTTSGETGAAVQEPTPWPGDARLIRCGWARWTDLIAALCERPGRLRGDETRYRRLHASLLAACRRGAAGPAPGRALHRRLGEILQPWVSLESLERTDPELLRSLLGQCREVEKALGVSRSTRRLFGRVRAAAAAFLTVWLVIQGASAVWRLPSAGAWRFDWRGVLASLQLDSVPGQVYLALPLVLLAALLTIRR